jgi:hypothetical protein
VSELFKDFAGPVATIIASWVAASYVSKQVEIAKTQADTDQVRYSLFQKRYAIYEDVKQLIKLLVNESHKKEFPAFDVAKHYIVMDEAVFFFSDEICSWLRELQNDCRSLMEARVASEPRKLADCKNRLIKHLESMPERFRNDLAFKQLTRKPVCN